jgi:enoyl-CoA hydratase/carnithine racemase
VGADDELVIEERHADGVCVISFNRPERHNAVNDALHDVWSAAVTAAIADSEVCCILLRGEGRSFSSGRDTAELGHRVAGESDLAFVRRHQQDRLTMLDAPKPVIAAVKGHVLGGAFEIALSADIRVASTDTSFGFPEIAFGLIADTGGTQLLTPLIGPSKAKYLLMTGRRIDADTALRWGLVDFVVAPAELDATALALAHELAASPPQAVAMIKQLVDHAWAGSIRAGIAQELLGQVALFAGEEHRAAKAARLAERTGAGA